MQLQRRPSVTTRCDVFTCSLPQNTTAKQPCIFNVNLEVTDASLTAGDIDALKKEMAAIFEAAGQKLVFNDPGPAAGTYNGTYSLTISARLPDALEQLNADPGYSGLVGITMGKTFMSDASYAFSDEKGHMINRGIVSTYWTGKYVPEGITFDAYLGQMGAHEAGHWFLKQLFGTGHAKDNLLDGS